jgi:hypothetical protein
MHKDDPACIRMAFAGDIYLLILVSKVPGKMTCISQLMEMLTKQRRTG